MTQLASIDRLIVAVDPLRQRLIQHPLYAAIQSLDDLRTFMEYHVYAVWDFMSLLKTLQRDLTCVTVPWLSQGDRLSRRLINEIVLAEESDESADGSYGSHFELYCEAMERCGADMSHVNAFLQRINRGEPLTQALTAAKVPEAAGEFVQSTWHIIGSSAPHMVAAAFAFGREALIPDMFRALVRDLRAHFPDQLDLVYYYFERHISLDENEHTPAAKRMVQELCNDNEGHWIEAQRAVESALKAREKLWDGILMAIQSQPEDSPAISNLLDKTA